MFKATLISLCAVASLHAVDTKPLQPFFEQHCYDCHDDFSAEGGLNLIDLKFDPKDTKNLSQWFSVLDLIEAGEMPPPKKKRPAEDDRKKVIAWLEHEIEEAESALHLARGRAEVRRLGREEHANALRDLLHLPHLTVADAFPPDGLSDGFGKSSAALPLSHIQLGRYLEVADEALRAAMAPQREKPTSQKHRIRVADVKGKTVKVGRRNGNEGNDTINLVRQSSFLYLALKEGYGMPITRRKRDTTYQNWPGNFAKRQPGYVQDKPPYMDAIGIPSHRTLPVGKEFRATHAGRYRLKLTAYSYRNKHGEVAPTDRTETVAFYSDTRLLGHLDVTPQSKTREVEFFLHANEEVSVTAASLPFWRLEGGEKGKRYHSVDCAAIAFEGFEMEGPLPEPWPPESHRRLFGDLPMEPRKAKGKELDYEVVSSSPEADAKKLLTSFITAAYRRPCSPADLKIPLGTYEQGLTEGASFQEALLSAYAAVLSSPHFILVPMAAGELPPDRLGNRLSLFLWNTPATPELLENFDPSSEALAATADKMLDDARVERFTEHFVDHWLDLRNIGVTEPDENLYIGYTPWLLESMRMETRAFVLHMLRENLPARSVFDSDFTFANSTLAELYDLPGVKGGQVKKVQLPADSIRGGLVTQGSILKVSANGTTTSPVVRGTYLMDRLLGDPPPPPPSSVPAVDPDLSGATTIRELLAKHRADPNCAACHQKIDPPGFALERFDVMGRLRDHYPSLDKGKTVEALSRRAKPVKFKLGLPVDASGELADGRPFKGIEDFRRHILRDERAIARNLLERLTTYATGAPVSLADRSEIERLLDQTAASDYGTRSLVHALIQSPLFRKK